MPKILPIEEYIEAITGLTKNAIDTRMEIPLLYIHVVIILLN